MRMPSGYLRACPTWQRLIWRCVSKWARFAFTMRAPVPYCGVAIFAVAPRENPALSRFTGARSISPDSTRKAALDLTLETRSERASALRC